MQAQLIVNRKGESPESVPLTVGKRYLVGRESGDIALRDAMCSSKHAELQFDGVTVTVRDLGSTNGTFFDGQRIRERTLGAGEGITIGACRIELELPQQMTAGGTLVAMPAFTGGAATPVAQQAVTQPVPTTASPAKPARAPTSKGTSLGVKLALAGAGGAAAILVALVVWAMSLQTGADGISNEGEATVKAVYFRGTPGKQVEGGTTQVVVRIARNTKPNASVGVLEEYSGGTGNQWRTATWLAAFNASRAAGIGLTDHEYIVRVGGHIDGPSAGMLITASMLALLKGDRIDPSATMTGTINPDGSAGPVGGIVQKMQGAAADGIKRFGYPIGLRNHTDLATGRDVDLHDAGAGLGLEVKEIPDLATAYEFLTGKPLPAVAVIDEADLQLDAETNQRLRAKLLAWKGRVDKELPTLNDQLKRMPGVASSMQDSLKYMNTVLERAATLEKSDLPAAALNDYVTGAALLQAMRETLPALSALGRLDFAAIQAQLDSARAGASAIAAFGNELQINARNGTVGGHVNLTRAAAAYMQAVALAQTGDANYESAVAILNGAKDRRAMAEAIKTAAPRLIMPIFFYSIAGTMLDAARDEKDLAADEGRATGSNLDALAREASAYGSAAGAALNYFDALEVEPMTAQGMSLEQARAIVSQQEFGYAVARSEASFAETVPTSVANPASTNLLRMAAGIDAYLAAASLVNKYYALGAKRTDDGIKLTHRKALSSQLDLARTFARQTAARAKERAGFVPVAARIAYQQASAQREGDDDSKVTALRSYWESAQWSELAARLSAPAKQ